MHRTIDPLVGHGLARNRYIPDRGRTRPIDRASERRFWLGHHESPR